jgi:outer membrane protein assembly factor BamB
MPLESFRLALRGKGRVSASRRPRHDFNHLGQYVTWRYWTGGGYGSYEICAIDAATGVLAWLLPTTDDGSTAVTVADGMTAYNSESCSVEVVNTASGERIWSRWLGDPLLAQPALSHGRLFSAWPHAGQHRFGAFGPRDGDPLWETDLAHHIFTAPVVCGGAVYVSSFDGAVSCFEASNGQRLASRDKFCWVVGDAVYVARRRRSITQSLADLQRASHGKRAVRTHDLDVRSGTMREQGHARETRKVSPGFVGRRGQGRLVFSGRRGRIQHGACCGEDRNGQCAARRSSCVAPSGGAAGRHRCSSL